MAGEEVKLLGESPYVLRAKIALKIKAVSYEDVIVDTRKKSELLVHSNPIYKKIPVLLHAGHAICESPIIIEYIDAIWSAPDSPSILPLDPYDRAVAKFWGVFIDDKLPPAFIGAIIGLTEAAKATHVEELHSVLQTLETVLAKCGEAKRFFGGENIGYVDIILGSTLSWIRATEKLTELKFLDEEDTPLLVNWVQRFCAHSAVKEMIPDPDKLVEVFPIVKQLWTPKIEATIIAAGGVLPN